MIFTKLLSFSKKPADMPNVLSPTYTPDDIRSFWETPSDELLTNVQKIVDDLNSTGWVDNSKLAPKAVGLDNLSDEITNQPTTPTGVQAALAQHDERLNEIAINVKYPPSPLVGAKGDGITDDTQTIKNIIAIADTILFPSGIYKITDELKFKHGQTVFAPNGVTLDGTNFVGTNGNSVLKVTNEGDNYTSLPSLSSDVTKGTNSLTFTANHNLSIGDIICLYDNTDFSWSSARSYYKKGEFCKVASITSATEILLEGNIFDDYTTNANFGVYKMNMGTFNVIGSLKIIQGKQGSFYGATFERLKDFHVDNIVVEANNGSYTAVLLNQCFNVHFHGTATQEKLSGLGGDYGLLISNCQHLDIKGYFSASRHGVTHGGNDGVGCVVVRDSKVNGTIKTNGLGNVEAANCHGNCELITFEGYIFGGISPSGQSIKVHATVCAESSGVCVLMSEVKKFDFDFSGSKFISYGNPQANSRGVIDFGGASTSDTDSMFGGTMNFSNIDLLAPNATVGLNIRTRNTNVLAGEEFNVKVNGKITTSSASGTIAYRVEDLGGSRVFNRVDTFGTVYNAENRVVIDTTNSFLELVKGQASFTTSTSSNYVDVAVTFNKPFPSGYTPNVSTNLTIGFIGSAQVICSIVLTSNTGFTVRVMTLNGTNFSAAITNKVYWTAQ